jgi:hypothetical protein
MNVKGFKKCCISNAMDGDDDDVDDDDVFWNDNEEDEDDRSVKKMEALPVKLETVTQIGR